MLSLRTAAILTNGAAKIYKEKVDELFEDMATIDWKMRNRRRSNNAESAEVSSSSSSTAPQSPASPEQMLEFERPSDNTGSPLCYKSRRTSIFPNCDHNDCSLSSIRKGSENSVSELSQSDSEYSPDSNDSRASDDGEDNLIAGIYPKDLRTQFYTSMSTISERTEVSTSESDTENSPREKTSSETNGTHSRTIKTSSKSRRTKTFENSDNSSSHNTKTTRKSNTSTQKSSFEETQEKSVSKSKRTRSKSISNESSEIESTNGIPSKRQKSNFNDFEQIDKGRKRNTSSQENTKSSNDKGSPKRNSSRLHISNISKQSYIRSSEVTCANTSQSEANFDRAFINEGSLEDIDESKGESLLVNSVILQCSGKENKDAKRKVNIMRKDAGTSPIRGLRAGHIQSGTVEQPAIQSENRLYAVVALHGGCESRIPCAIIYDDVDFN